MLWFQKSLAVVENWEGWRIVVYGPMLSVTRQTDFLKNVSSINLHQSMTLRCHLLLLLVKNRYQCITPSMHLAIYNKSKLYGAPYCCNFFLDLPTSPCSSSIKHKRNLAKAWRRRRFTFAQLSFSHNSYQFLSFLTVNQKASRANYKAVYLQVWSSQV